MKKIRHIWIYCLMVMLVILPTSLIGQSVKRQTIGSYGTSGMNNNAIIGQTIGQPFATVIYSDSQVSFAPGFQQPMSYKKNTVSPLLDLMSVDVFPNPAQHGFKIESQEPLQDAKIQIADIQGRLIMSKQIAEFESLTVNSSSWESGVYFITILTKDSELKSCNKVLITK